MEPIKTRDLATRLSRSQHVFLKDNPQLKKLFKKLQKKGVHNINDIQDKKTQNKLKKIIIECEVNWSFNIEGVIPYLTFSNHAPMQGDFSKAIPKTLKTLEKIKSKNRRKR